MSLPPATSDPRASSWFPRDALVGAVLLPALVMPVSLTIDAPDVHGGWAGHLTQTAALAVVGAFGAVVAARRNPEAGPSRFERWGAGLVVAAVLGFFAVRWGSELAQGFVLQRATWFGRGPVGPSFHGQWPGAAFAVLLLWPACLAGPGPAFAMALAVLSVVCGARVLAPLGVLPFPPDPLLALLVPALPWVHRRSEAVARGAWLVAAPVLAAAGAYWAGQLLLGEVRPGMPPPAVPLGFGPWLVGGAVVACVVGLWGWRKFGITAPSWPMAAGPRWDDAAAVLLGAACIAAVEPVLDLAAFVGDSAHLAHAPGPRPGAAWSFAPVPPKVLEAAAAATLMFLVVPASDTARLRRATVLFGLWFSALAGAMWVSRLFGGGAPTGAWTVISCVACVLAAWGSRHAPRPTPATWERHALGSLGAAVAALATWVLARAFTSVPPGGAILLVVTVLGALGSFQLAGRLPHRALPPRLRLAALALLGVARVLPIFTVIAVGLFPVAALGTYATLAAPILWVVSRRSWVALAAVPWLWFYAGFTLTMTYKAGATAATCAPILAATSGRVVVDRFGDLDKLPPHQRGDYARAEPYDAIADPRSGAAIVSWKHHGRGGGFLEAVDLQRPARRSIHKTIRPDGGPFWPERFEAVPGTGRTFVQLLGFGAYAMWELTVEPATAQDPPRIRPLRALPIRWEPSHPAVDVGRGRLVLSYVPNRDATNPIAEAFDLRDLRSVASTAKPRPRLEMSDFAAWDPTTGHLWVPLFFDFGRFALVEVDGETLQPRRFIETGFPAVGVAPDAARGRIFVTNVAGSELVVFDHDSLTVRERLPAGAFPRDLVYDAARSRLFVAGYGDGAVHTFDTTGPTLRVLPPMAVGPLLRGVGLDPSTGVVLAASACGVVQWREQGVGP